MERVRDEVPRHGKLLVHEILKYAPLLVVQGARQVGKSTLLHQALPETQSHFVTLDDPPALAFARSDPAGFIAQAPDKVLVIDEAQRAPDLALALKANIDANRAPGRFVMTGSVNMLKTVALSDSLAGRAETCEVFPLSQGEITFRPTPEDWVNWLVDLSENGDEAVSLHDLHDAVIAQDMREYVVAGGYPEPLKRPNKAAHRWYKSYLERIVDHDARQLAGASPFPVHLNRLLRLIAAQGQAELVKAKTARELGISESTLGDYLQLAQAMYLIDETSSWGIGFSGRVIRRPKIALRDTGLASYLAGFTAEKARQAGGFELFGATLEAFVVGELRKQQSWSAQDFQIFHYRQRNEEVDIVIELTDGRVILVEVKSSQSVNEQSWRHLDSLMSRLGDRVVTAVVLYLGTDLFRISLKSGKVLIAPVSTLWQHK